MSDETRVHDRNPTEPWVPDDDRWRCERCGEVVGSLGGMVFSHSGDGSSFQGHYDEAACEAETRVNYKRAFSTAHQALQDLARFAWVAFTEDLTDDEWEAVPVQVRGSLTSLYHIASEAASHTFYEASREEPVSEGATP